MGFLGTQFFKKKIPIILSSSFAGFVCFAVIASDAFCVGKTCPIAVLGRTPTQGDLCSTTLNRLKESSLRWMPTRSVGRHTPFVPAMVLSPGVYRENTPFFSNAWYTCTRRALHSKSDIETFQSLRGMIQISERKPLPEQPDNMSALEKIRPRHTLVDQVINTTDGWVVLEDFSDHPQDATNLYKIGYDFQPHWDAPINIYPELGGADHYTYIEFDHEKQILICSTILETHWICPKTGKILYSEYHK